MGGPVLPNIEPLIAMGINPKTGLPVKFGGTNATLKEDFKKILRIVDEQDAVNRYTWYNLPNDLTSQELERMIYYKGQLCFFYDEGSEKFYFLPYALDGGIDLYGRYAKVHPVPMSAGTSEEDKKVINYLARLKLNVVYGMKLYELTEEDLFNSCVLLHDYTKQLSQNNIPRQVLQEPVLDLMAECMPYMRTNLIAASGIRGMRVQNADEADNVKDSNRAIRQGALQGDINVPIEGAVEFQELTGSNVSKSEEYMLAMQSLDNFRLGTYGIDNGGLFEKKAHELQSEADINGGPVGLVLQDGLQIRQHFCNIVNSIWGLGIWCEVNENIAGADLDADGLLYADDQEGASTGLESPNEGGEENA